MDPKHKIEMTRALDALLNERAFDGRAVLLFGHCNATEEAADYLFEHGAVPAAVMDNSASKRGTAWRGIPIVPPEDIRKYGANDSIVLIAARFFAEMSAQLRRLDYGGRVVRLVEYDTFSEYSLTDETLERRKARMARGAGTLERLRNRYGRRHLIICPHNALGDVYWAMSFLPAYCGKHDISETAIIVTGGGCRQTAEMFGAEHVAALDEAEMDELVQAVIFTREKNCVIAHHDRPYTDNSIKYLDKGFLSLIDYYKRAVYGLPEETPPAPPTKINGLDGMPGIVRGGTVIIAPYAKSVVQPPDSFWEKLAGQWKKDGYSVFTNVNGGEPPIRGTAPLSLPLNMMISAVEYAGAFAGLRSGLCDVVHTAGCRKTVVFPDCFYSTTPHKVKDFFALPGWESIICD